MCIRDRDTLRRSAFVRHYKKGAFVHSSDNEMCIRDRETKWTEKEIGFQVELEEVKYTANEGLFMHILSLIHI